MVSGDAFQCKLDAIYRDLPQTIGAADDMIIWGDKDDVSDHDETLHKFFQTMGENNLHLGFDKMQYHRSKINFFGGKYTNKGHQPTNDKIKAISDME